MRPLNRRSFIRFGSTLAAGALLPAGALATLAPRETALRPLAGQFSRAAFEQYLGQEFSTALSGSTNPAIARLASVEAACYGSRGVDCFDVLFEYAGQGGVRTFYHPQAGHFDLLTKAVQIEGRPYLRAQFALVV